MEKMEKFGNEMTTRLGMHNELVFGFWTEFEQGNYGKCQAYYDWYLEKFNNSKKSGI